MLLLCDALGGADSPVHSEDDPLCLFRDLHDYVTTNSSWGYTPDGEWEWTPWPVPADDFGRVLHEFLSSRGRRYTSWVGFVPDASPIQVAL